MIPFTVLAVSACTDVAGQMYLASRQGHVRDALRDYRSDPDAWALIGIVNSRGALVAFDSPEHWDTLKACEPIAGGNQWHLVSM